METNSGNERNFLLETGSYVANWSKISLALSAMMDVNVRLEVEE